jgi:F420-non-reducing hydrogenase large subunit
MGSSDDVVKSIMIVGGGAAGMFSALDLAEMGIKVYLVEKDQSIVKAADGVYGVDPTPTVKKIRELFLNAHYVEDHCAILYALGFPDFVLGPTADPASRNLIGLISAVGAETGKLVLRKRFSAVKIIEILGGKPLHSVTALPGGWSKWITEEERLQMLELSKDLIELGQLTLKVFEDVVLKNEKYMELVVGDSYKAVVNYMATVDENGKCNYYDGTHKVIDINGKEIASFKGMDYLNLIAERTLPWSYLKMPYLKQIGWKGVVDGEGTGLYAVGPLARFNVSNGYDTPEAQEHYEKMVSAFGGKKPVYNILVYHWARAVELLNAAEKVQKLLLDESITNPDVRAQLGKPNEGVGIIEAVRGTLIHHYKTDDKGIVTNANLIVATTHNMGLINIAVRRAAQSFIKSGIVNEGLVNMVEMAYRPYDICFACATHTLPGRMPIEIDVFKKCGTHLKNLRNF